MRRDDPILRHLSPEVGDTGNANTAAAPHAPPPSQYPRSGPQNDINGRGGRPRHHQPPSLARWRAGANGGRRLAAHSVASTASAAARQRQPSLPPLNASTGSLCLGRGGVVRGGGGVQRMGGGVPPAGCSLRPAMEGGACRRHWRHASAVLDTGMAAG